MKISELTAAMVKDFTGISDEDSDDIVGTLLMPAAKAYIVGYTGLTEEQLDDHDDLAAAFCVLVNDMFTNRDYTISSHRQLSPTVKNILSMYAVNHLG
ncbi:MAG: phage gp6-like head-tail connector protein [Ruminococcus sp.]|nr:phage gp6-like head-tail connector protein [Ruminococcus sp.]